MQSTIRTVAHRIDLAPVKNSNVKSIHKSRKIAISTQEGIFIVPIQNIIHCSSDGNYSSIHLMNGKQIYVSKTLKAIENALPSKLFFRAHNSHLIAIDEIAHCGTNGICLSNNTLVPVSKTKRALLKELIKNNFVQI